MIFIGSHLGGPEICGTSIDKAIMATMRAAIEARGSFREGSIPAVNVVFFTPGSITGEPDWDHGKVAKYSTKRKLVLIQVAIPKEMVSSNTALDFLIGELYGANALAFEFYRQKGIQYPLAEAEKLVKQIADAVAGWEAEKTGS